MKLLLLLLLSFIICNVNSQITKVSSPQYGVSSIITIEGTGFGSSPSIKINNVACTTKTSSATQITCGPFSSQFTPVTDTFTVAVTFSSGPSLTSVFKYATPTIGYYDIDYDKRYFYFSGSNLSPITSYKLSVVDTSTSTLQLTPTADSSSQINFLLPKTLTGGDCTFTVSDTVGFTYPNPLDIITVLPVIQSISPSKWSPEQSKSISISGYFFGKTINVKIGDHMINDIPVSDNGLASFNSPLGFMSSNDITIITTKQYSLTSNDSFSYVAPSITSITQDNDTITIEASNIGTDESFIKVSINDKSSEYKFENGIISVVLSPAINIGKTKVSIMADVQNANDSILIQPVITHVSSIPSIGGKITIEGAFLNDCYFKLYDNSSNLVKDMVDSSGNNLCTLSSTGKVATCITPEMTANSTFTITAIRYTDNTNSTSESKSTSMQGTIYYAEPETPTPTNSNTPSTTPTPTDTPSITPTPTNSNESSDDNTPSLSSTLLPNLFIISSFVIYILI